MLVSQAYGWGGTSGRHGGSSITSLESHPGWEGSRDGPIFSYVSMGLPGCFLQFGKWRQKDIAKTPLKRQVSGCQQAFKP